MTRTRPTPFVSRNAPSAATVESPTLTIASAMSSASGFQRRARVRPATRGKALRPEVTSGAVTGKMRTPARRQRRAVMTNVAGVSVSASRKRAMARSSSWLSSTTSRSPSVARSSAREARGKSPALAREVPNRKASISSIVRASHGPTRNQSTRPPKRFAIRWPSAAASIDFPLPPGADERKARRCGRFRSSARASRAPDVIVLSGEGGEGSREREPGHTGGMRRTRYAAPSSICSRQQPDREAIRTRGGDRCRHAR